VEGPEATAVSAGHGAGWQQGRTLVTGGAGFLGSHVVQALRRHGCHDVVVPRRREYDLVDAAAVRRVYADVRPRVVIHLAGVVGGIEANRRNPGRFFHDNMAMGLHVVEEARRARVDKLVMIGTVCSYPKSPPVPFREDDLWNGFPEETNAPYGIAKKALFVMAAGYRAQYGLNAVCLLPVNLYGPRDNFDPDAGHVIPALIRRCVDARERGSGQIVCWGSGTASREFLYVEDCAEAIVLATERYDAPEPVNIGGSDEITIRDLAALVAKATGFTGDVVWDPSRPDGQPRRCVDASRAEKAFGFRAKTPLVEGLRRTVAWYEAGRR
jgi:GDP-L-fucose synthase